MDIAAIIAALKARCPSFASRVAGAAEYKRLPETANLDMPAAYVIPLDDSPDAMQGGCNSYRQKLLDSFAVVVAMSNTADERGQTAITSVSALRAELWAALLGWDPDASHGQIEYGGGQLIDLDRARMYYQFEFSAETEITEADTWIATRNAALPAFTEVGLTVDAIDPHDPNRAASGPDGTTEATVVIPVPQ